MAMMRRLVLLMLVGVIGGCTPHQGGMRPGPRWPSEVSVPNGPGREPTYGNTASGSVASRGDHETDGAGPLGVIPRQQWTQHRARPGSVNAMNGINRITVHHEGWEQVYYTGYAKTAQRLERIRHSHVNNHGWGDIGYHFVVDRAGRVWEARDLRYQGAHVSDHNKHNVGVMVLGNFQEQYPSQEQLRGLQQFLGKLMRRYNVAASRVYTHRELGQTSCPGQHLQPKLDAWRRNGRLR